MYFRKNLIIGLLITLIFIISCYQQDPVSVVKAERQTEDERFVLLNGSLEGEKDIDSLLDVETYPIYSSAINNKGYFIDLSEAATYKGKDWDTGSIGNFTLIPCLPVDENDRFARIVYARVNGKYMVTAAEFYESENFAVPHSLDYESVNYHAANSELDVDSYSRSILNIEQRINFWKCWGIGSLAGAAGCAYKCALTGPGFWQCMLICGGARVIISGVACALVYFFGGY